MEIEQALKAVRDVYVNFPKLVGQLEEDLKRLDAETQDLLHLAELTQLSASKGYDLYKEIQKVRQERRKVKDQLEMLEPIKEINSYVGKPAEKNINKMIGEVRKIATRHENRTYRMRVRNDLQEMVCK